MYRDQIFIKRMIYVSKKNLFNMKTKDRINKVAKKIASQDIQKIKKKIKIQIIKSHLNSRRKLIDVGINLNLIIY
jgi:hypothetical protein